MDRRYLIYDENFFSLCWSMQVDYYVLITIKLFCFCEEFQQLQ